MINLTLGEIDAVLEILDKEIDGVAERDDKNEPPCRKELIMAHIKLSKEQHERTL